MNDLPQLFTLHSGEEDLKYVSILSSSISLLSLFLHLISFLTERRARRLSDKNTASLSFALLMAYLMLLLNRFEFFHQPKFCAVISIIMYYFLLSSFCWMNVLSYDVWRCMIASSKCLLINGEQWLRFTLYSIYGWSISLLFMLTALLICYVDDLVPVDYKPDFTDEKICWFHQGKSLFIFFDGPVAIIMTVNLCFFIHTAWIIVRTRDGCISRCINIQRNDYLVYFKLAFLMGLSWCADLVCSFADYIWIHYFAETLGTCQCIFIFISYSWTQKRISRWRKKLIKISGKYTISGGRNSTEPNQIVGGNQQTSTTTLTSIIEIN